MKKKIVTPRKKQEVITNEEEAKGTQTQVLEKPEPVKAKREERDLTEKAELSYEQYVIESRKALEHPLAPGQQFFESPEGEIIVGEADRTHVWSRRANGGKGAWVNPKR